MINKPPQFKKKDDKDILNRVIGAATEEMEKVGDSISTQITGDANIDQPNPIAEAMQQKTEEEDIGKQNKIDTQKKFIRTREDLDAELRKLKKEREEQNKTWGDEVERQFKIVDPGEGMGEAPVIPLTTKPKRGFIRGKPGTAKGETGPEVRKSKQ